MAHPSQHQLDSLRLDWTSIRRSRASQNAAATLIAQHPELTVHAISDLGDVVDLLEPAGSLTQIERARIAAVLLESCPLDAMIPRALLQTLLPGVVSVARRLRWGRGGDVDPSGFLADLITLMYELIVEWSGQIRPYAAPDLLNALRCRMQRRMTNADPRELSFARPDGSHVDHPAPAEFAPWESVLGEMLDAGRTEDRIGAAALYGREVLGYSYRELAEMTGISPRRLAAAGREVARRIQA